MLRVTENSIMSRGQVQNTSQRLEGRLGPETYKRVVGMVEVARAFVLVALLIN
jgi:hypothetical protein